MDPSILQFLAAPFVASLILTGIHTYLGVHVVERGVIFVDLSLAQIAALGATVAMLVPFSGGDPHGPGVYWFSLGFTFIGAAVFSLVHHGQKARIPQEAVIGISYAVASAASILAMSQSTAQGEHLKDMLVGNILAVSWPEVGKTAALYGVVGLFHYLYRQRFLLISMDPDRAEPKASPAVGILFYSRSASSSPRRWHCRRCWCSATDRAVGGGDDLRRIGVRLAIGWVMGTVVSILGMYFSVLFDLPTGATIVCTFGLVLVVMALCKPIVVRLQRA